MTVSQSALFQPIKVGNLQLNRRVVLASLTRLRTITTSAPKPALVEEYYEQRASTPGTLLISAATLVAEKAAGAPVFWSQEQIDSWKEITKTVHDKGSHIFLQMATLGRFASEEWLKQRNASWEIVGPSNDDVALLFGPSKAHGLTVDEIKEYLDLYVEAAGRAVDEAGFDGIEIHGANGFLPDQFLRPVSNHREDQYGGIIENRSHFTPEIVEAIAKAIGPERTALRLSPWNYAFGVEMDDPIPQFSHLVSALKKQNPDLAYLHIIEPRVSGIEDLDPTQYWGQSNDFIRRIWGPAPLISAGGWQRDSGIAQADQNHNELLAYGRHFIANISLLMSLRERVFG